jgi:hypothetical protein
MLAVHAAYRETIKRAPWTEKRDELGFGLKGDKHTGLSAKGLQQRQMGRPAGHDTIYILCTKTKIKAAHHTHVPKKTSHHQQKVVFVTWTLTEITHTSRS